MTNNALTEGQDSLLGSDDASLDHEPVLIDNTIVGESSHGGDGLKGEIVLSGGVVLVRALANTVDLLVHLGTVVVSVLTGAWHGEGHTGRVPRSNTSDLAKTSVGLTGKALDSPTSGDSLVTLTLGDTDDVDHLVLLEDSSNGDLLLEPRLGTQPCPWWFLR